MKKNDNEEKEYELKNRANDENWTKPDIDINSPIFKRNPVKAIRSKCLDCCGNSAKEVEFCLVPTCPLYPFRFGKNPYRTSRKKSLTDEQRKAIGKRLRKARENN